MCWGLLLMVPGPSGRARRPLSRGGAGSAAGRLLRLGLCVAELRPLRRQQGAAAAAKSQTLEDRCPMTSGRAVETGAERPESVEWFGFSRTGAHGSETDRKSTRLNYSH